MPTNMNPSRGGGWSAFGAGLQSAGQSLAMHLADQEAERRRQADVADQRQYAEEQRSKQFGEQISLARAQNAMALPGGSTLPPGLKDMAQTNPQIWSLVQDAFQTAQPVPGLTTVNPVAGAPPTPVPASDYSEMRVDADTQQVQYPKFVGRDTMRRVRTPADEDREMAQKLQGLQVQGVKQGLEVSGLDLDARRQGLADADRARSTREKYAQQGVSHADLVMGKMPVSTQDMDDLGLTELAIQYQLSQQALREGRADAALDAQNRMKSTLIDYMSQTRTALVQQADSDRDQALAAVQAEVELGLPPGEAAQKTNQIMTQHQMDLTSAQFRSEQEGARLEAALSRQGPITPEKPPEQVFMEDVRAEKSLLLLDAHILPEATRPQLLQELDEMLQLLQQSGTIPTKAEIKAMADEVRRDHGLGRQPAIRAPRPGDVPVRGGGANWLKPPSGNGFIQ